jgi:hypothetical protein
MSMGHRRVKYVLVPGFVVSESDGQRHHIGAVELASLYRVSMSECVVYDAMRCGAGGYKGLVHLRPRFDGDYRIPKGAA